MNRSSIECRTTTARDLRAWTAANPELNHLHPRRRIAMWRRVRKITRATERVGRRVDRVGRIEASVRRQFAWLDGLVREYEARERALARA